MNEGLALSDLSPDERAEAEAVLDALCQVVARELIRRAVASVIAKDGGTPYHARTVH
jgi:hypothetical protein